jgi:cystathionine beta-lyase/cystathionine gamma-synthase
MAPMPDTDRPDGFDAPADAFATRAVHAGAEPDEVAGAVSPPIYQTSTYAQEGVGRPRGGYEYARTQNPTRERLERAVAELEGGAFGIAFASGSAAVATLAELAAPGEEIVVGDDVYGGTFRFCDRVARPRGLVPRYVDWPEIRRRRWPARWARGRGSSGSRRPPTRS